MLGVLAVVFLGGGGNGFDIGQGFGTSMPAPAPGAHNPAPIPADEAPQRDLKDFSSLVFDDVQTTWEGTFERGGGGYNRAKLVLYTNDVTTNGCGRASSAVEPFYCPADQRVYLDLSFYEDLSRELGAAGDFA